MAIGDDLMADRGGLVGPISFTPDMQKAGIKLMPSGNTKPARTFTPRGQGDPFLYSPEGNMNFRFVGPSTGDFNPTVHGISPTHRDRIMPFFEGLENGLGERANRAAPSAQQMSRGKPLITPDDVRPRNPFNPEEREVPEDDALTPPGVLAPSEIKEQGNMLSKLGDFLTNPASGKFLAALGMAITPSQDDPLGMLAIDMAENRARGQFRQGLESGQSAGDILVPGLSTRGREAELQQFEQERSQRTAEELDRSQEKRLTAATEANIQRGELLNQKTELEIQALQDAEAAAETGDPNAIIEAGLNRLGIQPRGNMDLKKAGYTPQQAFQLVERLAILEGMDRQSGGQSSPESKMSEAMRQVAEQTAGERLQHIQQAFQSAIRQGQQTSDILREMRNAQEALIAAGGDPADWAGAPTGGGEEADPREQEIQMIMDATGLGRETVERLDSTRYQAFLKAAQEAQ